VTGYLVDFIDACRLLKRHGIAVVHSAYVTSPEEALEFYHGPIPQYHAEPLTLKVITPKAIEKNVKGLALVGLSSDAEVRRGYLRLADAAEPYVPFKIVAQPTIKGRHLALAVGSRTDRDGKKWLFLGLLPRGGKSVSEKVERSVPVTEDFARAMISELHSARALAPRRRDLTMLKHFLVNTSRMIEKNHIVELELNPVILHENQYTAVDIKMFTDRSKLKHLGAKRPAADERDLMSLERREEARRVRAPEAKARLARKR
jgi:hypothetical protein